MKDQHSIHAEVSSISTVVSNLPQIAPFVAPEGYFHTFPDRILSRINGQSIEKEELSPFLQSLRKENPFSTPPDYLAQFQVKVPNNEIKVVGLFTIKTVLKYAVAAALIGIIVTFATLFSSNEPINASAIATDESKISSDAYALYLSETEELNESEVETTIDDSQSLLVLMDAGLVSEILKEIPENQISTYLDLIKNEDLHMMN